MGAMPGNRERKDCQTDLEGVRDRARKHKWEDARNSLDRQNIQ